MIAAALLLSLSALPRAWAAPAWQTKFADAQAQAKAAKRPLLIDFQAPWCYSCYYMEQRVLEKPRFEKAAEKLALLKLDVDSPEGRELKERFRVSFLPTYVVLSPSGKELGRIIGEQTEDDYLKRLDAIASAKADPGADAEGEKLLARAKAGDVSAVEKYLERPADCTLPYAVEYGEPAAAKLDADRKQRLLQLERSKLDELARAKLFVPEPQRCADFRSGVEALADVYQALGQDAARKAVLRQAVDQLSEGPAIGEDRNHDDNLRYFLELSGDEAKLKDVYDKLLAAYPSDYVYAYRYAKHLQSRGRSKEALPLIQQADRLCYGGNRLQVALVRYNVLASLGRKAEGRRLAERDLNALGHSFPEQAKALRAALPPAPKN